MNNVLGKPAIFLCGRYVASYYLYYKNYDIFITMCVTLNTKLMKNSGM